MNPYDRETLEQCILGITFTKPWHADKFLLNESDFDSPNYWKIFLLCSSFPEEIHTDAKAKGSVLLGAGVKMIFLAKLMSNEILELATFAAKDDYVNLCQQLRDLSISETLAQKAKYVKTPEELRRLAQEIEVKEASTITENFKEYTLNRYSDKYEERRKRASDDGLSFVSGFNRFDKHVSMRGPELVVLGARTSIGKTAFALNIAYQSAMLGQKVVYVNLEMAPEQIADRLFALASRRPIDDFYSAKAEWRDYDQETQFLGKNLYLFTGSISSDAIGPRFASLRPDIIIVDYLNVLNDRPVKNELETYRVGRQIDNLKELAKQRGCIVFLLAQLNRKSEGQEGKIDSFRDSGTIEQVADTCLILNRERDSDLAMMKVAKRRNGESGAEIGYVFKREIGQFVEQKYDEQVKIKTPSRPLWQD